MADQTFDDLMKSMGVRKMDRKNVRQPEAKRTHTPSPTPTKKKAASGELTVSKSERRLRERVRVLEKKCAEQDERIETHRNRILELESERDALSSVVEESRAALRTNEMVLRNLRGEEDVPGTGLDSALKERGILGIDERRKALVALGEARVLNGLVKHLVLPDRVWAQDWLEREMVLVCSGTECRTISGVAVVSGLTPSRCEVCGGEGLEQGVRDFVSALLMNGWHRCLFLGGPSWSKRIMGSVIDDGRLEIGVVPWRARSSTKNATHGFRPELVIHWHGADDLSGKEPEYIAEEAVSVTTRATTLIGAMKDAAKQVSEMD